MGQTQNKSFRIKLPQILLSGYCCCMDIPCKYAGKVFDIPYALSANDDDKLLLATMMEAAMNTWSIGGNNVDNLFAAIAVMLMLTVIPHMIFLGWRIRRGTKATGTLRARLIMYNRSFAHIILAIILLIWIVPSWPLLQLRSDRKLPLRLQVLGQHSRQRNLGTVSAHMTKVSRLK